LSPLLRAVPGVSFSGEAVAVTTYTAMEIMVFSLPFRIKHDDLCNFVCYFLAVHISCMVD